MSNCTIAVSETGNTSFAEKRSLVPSRTVNHSGYHLNLLCHKVKHRSLRIVLEWG